MDNYYNNYNNISNLLLSLDSYIIKDALENAYVIKTLITYDIDIIIKIFKNYIQQYSDINLSQIDKFTNIVSIIIDNQIFYIYCYNYSLSRYYYNSTECYFDCNLIYIKYNSNYFIFNHYSILYNEIYYRRINRKFCYLVDNFQNILFLLIRNTKISTTLKNYYISKINYAQKLILNGWIMDEYYLRDKSWTINYWINYVTKLSVIKLKNNIKNKIENKCIFCNIKFNNSDIIFNINNLYIHHKCIINKLYS